MCTAVTGVPSVGGLVGLAEEFLNVRSWKRKRVTMSDWTSEKLSQAQINYSAYDALAARMIYDALQNYNSNSGSGRGTIDVGTSAVKTGINHRAQTQVMVTRTESMSVSVYVKYLLFVFLIGCIFG